MKELKNSTGNTLIGFDQVAKYTFLALIFVTPFQHTTALRSLLLLICLLYVLFDIFRNGFDWSIPFKASILLWLMVTWISVTYTMDIQYTLGELRHETFYTLLVFYCGYLVSKNGLNVDSLFIVFLAAFTVITVVAIPQYHMAGMWKEEHIVSFRGYGNYLIFALPLLFYFIYRLRKTGWLVFPVIVSLAALYAGILSEVRMIWLVILAQVVVAVGLYFKSNKMGKNTKIIVLVLMVVIFLVSLKTLQHVNEVRKGKDLQVSVVQDPRIERWPEVINIIIESPYYGLGFGKDLFGEKYPEFDTGHVRYFTHAHNLVLDYGVMLGVPGIIVIIALFVSMLIFFYKGYRKDMLLSSIALILIIGLLAKNMTDDFFGKDVSLIFWIFMGVLSGALVRHQNAVDNQS